MNESFHCSRFAHADVANMFQLLLQVSNLSVFLSAFVRADTIESLTFYGVPARVILHEIKIAGRSARAGKATAMENGLKE